MTKMVKIKDKDNDWELVLEERDAALILAIQDLARAVRSDRHG